MNAILRTAALAGALSLAGCATAPPPTADFHDPTPSEKAARIVARKIVQAYVRPAGPSVPRTVVPVTLPSDLTIFINVTALRESHAGTVDLNEYRVKTADGRTVVVYSDYFALESGACVTLQESRKATYPRIERTDAARCSGIS